MAFDVLPPSSMKTFHEKRPSECARMRMIPMISQLYTRVYTWRSLHSISGFSTILNRLGSKLEGMLFGIVPMFVPNDFVRHRFVAPKCACTPEFAHICAMPNKILWHEHWNYPKDHAYQFICTVKISGHGTRGNNQSQSSISVTWPVTTNHRALSQSPDL